MLTEDLAGMQVQLPRDINDLTLEADVPQEWRPAVIFDLRSESMRNSVFEITEWRMRIFQPVGRETLEVLNRTGLNRFRESRAIHAVDGTYTVSLKTLRELRPGREIGDETIDLMGRMIDGACEGEACIYPLLFMGFFLGPDPGDLRRYS